MMTRFKYVALLILALCGLNATAQRRVPSFEENPASRPVEGIYSLEFGGAEALSTYLSPMYYDGPDFTFAGSWTKIFNRWQGRTEMRFEGALSFQPMMNPARTADMYGAQGQFAWGLAWRKPFLRNWTVTAGGMLDLYGGALYLTRNSNNPVTALAYSGLDIAGSLSYRFKIGKLPIIVEDRLRIPSIGAFFTPGYGETYYEIYLGNHDGLAHCGWWGNAFAIDNLLQVKLYLGRTAMTVGYRLDYRSFHANHLETTILKNSLSIGIIP